MHLALGEILIAGRLGESGRDRLRQLEPADGERRALEQPHLALRDRQHVEVLRRLRERQQGPQVEVRSDTGRLVQRERRRDELEEARSGVVGKAVGRIGERILHPGRGVRRPQQLVADRLRGTGLGETCFGQPQRLAPASEVGALRDATARHRNEE